MDFQLGDKRFEIEVIKMKMKLSGICVMSP